MTSMGRTRTRRWFSRILGVIASLTALGIVKGSVETTPTEGLQQSQATPTEQPRPACQNGKGQLREKFLMLVSTLDGKVSALDVRNDGKLVWSLQADMRPLLSSSIGQMEVTRDGVRTRLIPSLDGGLYQYDGDSIEAVPMTAETLLASSLRLSDNTMMIGGKDIRTYGIDANSGQVRYLCTMAGCHYIGDSEFTTEEDILVLTRNTQTVRAVDARMGTEKWNFSVGKHEIELLDGDKAELTNTSEEDEDGITITACNPSGEEITKETKNDFEGFLKIIVPDGMVVALSPEDSSDVLWQHKFSSPVANAWLLEYGALKTVNLFDSDHVPALSSFQPDSDSGIRQDPLLYVGMHQSQLYVQQSQRMQEKVAEALKNAGQKANQPLPRVSWRPYLNTAPSRTPIMKNSPGQISMIDVKSTDSKNKKTQTSLTVWHENYPFDNGYYLYPDIIPWPEIEQVPNDSVVPPGMMDMVLPVSLWNWWKEVILISIITSIVVHIMITKYQRREHLEFSANRLDSEGSEKTDSSSSAVDSSLKLPDLQKTLEYTSRFLSDFQLLHCLGKGGFGIVFEARNHVDDQCYAVKRICMPNSEGSQKRVLREVKALAKLDHVGIVRFFNAWVETPPPGWQEERDKTYEDSECLTPTPCNSGTDMSSMSSFPPNQAMEPFLGNKQDDVNEYNSKLILYNNLRQGESSSFSLHSNEDCSTDESGSYSCVGIESHKPNLFKKHTCDATSDSFSIEFVNSDTESNNNHINSFEKSNVPFAPYQDLTSDQQLEKTDSFSIVFEDSNCNDRSSSGVTSCSQKSNLSEDNVSQNTTSKDQSSCDKKSESQNTHPSALKRQTAVNIPKLYLYIQMQLCKRETLKDWLSANTLNRNRHIILDIFTQIVCAVDYVHKQGLMHRDLKPNNIFFSVDDTIKVGDFGLVTPLAEQVTYTNTDVGQSSARHTAEVGTQLYMSPEQISKKPYDHKVDIFSLGMILFELLYPFSTQMERVRTLMNCKKQLFPERFEREMPTECKCVKWLLSPTPSDRPSAMLILDHELLKDFVPKKTENRFRTLSGGSNSSSTCT